MGKKHQILAQNLKSILVAFDPFNKYCVRAREMFNRLSSPRLKTVNPKLEVKTYIRVDCPDNDPLVHVEYGNNEKEKLNCAQMDVEGMLEHLSRRTREIDAASVLTRAGAEPIMHVRIGKKILEMTPENIAKLESGEISFVTGESSKR